MQLIFDSLGEFEQFLDAMGYVHRGNLAELTYGEITLRGSEKFVKDLTDAGQPPFIDQLENGGDPVLTNSEATGIERDTTGGVTAVQPTENKRKRRTKAEIKAEKAAQTQGATLVTGNTGEGHTPHGDTFKDGSQASPLDNLKPEDPTAEIATMADAARVAITEMAPLFTADKLAQLEEGRNFIAAHGFQTYNETMSLADVPSNISAHTPEQVSRHRAAMAWLAEQRKA